MRRLLTSYALCTAWLLTGMLESSSAQTPGRPVVVPGPSVFAPPAGSPPQPLAVEMGTIALPLRPPSLSLVEMTEPPAAGPKLGAIVPVSYFPITQRSAPNPPEHTITLSETVVITSITESAPSTPASGGAPSTSLALPTFTALQPSGMPAVFPRSELAPRRKSYVDLSAAACFAHAPDYNWIFGQVEYSSVAKEWRLRYASVDETDRYGGRVSLIENHHVGQLREGMYVHVRGHLMNPENTSNGPTHYRIEWFRPIDNPNTEQTPDATR